MREVTLNLGDLPLQASGHGSRFEARSAELGVRLGLFGLGAALFEVPPGKVSGPLHRHHTSDEMFVILAGTGTYRYGGQRIAVRAGDCLAAPAAREDPAHEGGAAEPGHGMLDDGTLRLAHEIELGAQRAVIAADGAAAGIEFAAEIVGGHGAGGGVAAPRSAATSLRISSAVPRKTGVRNFCFT